MTTPRLKVIHLTIGLEWGGAENLMADIASRLDPTVFEVKVVALQKEGPVGGVLREAGIPLTTLNFSGWWDPRAYFQLKKYLASERPDIVHAHLLRANLLACLTRTKHAVVWHEHGTGEWLNPILRFLEKYFIARSNAVIAISNNVRDNLVERIPGISNRVSVLPNAVDLRRWNLLAAPEKTRRRKDLWGLGPEHLIVGFAGRLDEQFKGITFLLKSLALIKKRWPQLRLVIVGGGKDDEFLKKTADQLELQNIVLFMGPRSDLDMIYPAFDLLALPSLSEGFGIVLLEAMASSLPVVASRVGGIPEVVVDQETGLLVSPGNSQMLAEALEKLLKDPDWRQRLGQNGRKRVEGRYNFDSILSKLGRIYFDITHPMKNDHLS